MPRRSLKICLFITCLVLLLLVLTGCACKHETTEVVKAADATCTAEGYTGDTVCTECDETVTAGEVIPATGHTDGEVRDAADATCTAEGYTGDTYCAVCGEKTVTGEAIPMLEHTPAEEPVGVIPAECEVEGYSGDIVCEVCGETVTAGEAIPAPGHTEGEATGAVEPTCTDEGYTGDTYCTVCEILLNTGEAIPVVEHTPAEEPDGAAEAACETEGYTGDILCAVCGGILTEGEAIPATGHAWGEPEGVVEASCVAEGYTGDKTCTVCGAVEAGEAVAMLADHAYVDGVCTCGWMESGLYVDGAKVKSWDELIDEGLVVVDGGVLVSVAGDLQMGVLVIDEEITYIDGRDNVGFNCDTLTGVWVPRSVTELGRYLLAGNTTVAEVKLFCPVTALADYSFSRSKALTTITLPGTLESIGAKAFNGCTVTTVYYGGDAETWEAIGGAAALPDAEVITK